MTIATPVAEDGAPASTKITVSMYDQCGGTSKKPEKITIEVEPTETLEGLYEKYAERLKYELDKFEFNFVKEPKRYSAADLARTLHELGYPGGSKLVGHLIRRPGSRDEDFHVARTGQPIGGTVLGGHRSASPPLPPPPPQLMTPLSGAIIPHPTASSTASTTSAFSSMGLGYSDWNKKSKTGFCGLSNQGATCYMNSLIQTLYMTPEFRAALYKWSFDEAYNRLYANHEMKEDAAPQGPLEAGKVPLTPEERKLQFRFDKEKNSIPRQLQLLFARLQLSDQKAVKTKALTSSFGWKESDAFTQHDVQELCRVLFDALERVLKGTEQEKLITELYQGEMQDYVRCKECNYESIRPDKYLDVPLVIRGFGSKVAVRSVEEALHKFVHPEDLDGENQYFCERCQRKVDAQKGLKFVTFPYLLTLQLKRFDFDYQMFRRIKLNDRVAFPTVLDMNQFLLPPESKTSADAAPEAGPKTDVEARTAPKPQASSSSSGGKSVVGRPRTPGPSAGQLPNKRKRAVSAEVADDGGAADEAGSDDVSAYSLHDMAAQIESPAAGRRGASVAAGPGLRTSNASTENFAGSDDDSMPPLVPTNPSHAGDFDVEMSAFHPASVMRSQTKSPTDDYDADADDGDLESGASASGQEGDSSELPGLEDQQPEPPQEEPSLAEQANQMVAEKGPYVYELYSILIHRGSALGGHYYAYIKSMDTGKWYEFNDSQVTEIDEREIAKTFGEESDGVRRGGMSALFQSSANAYMLMYRRWDPEKNQRLVSSDNSPVLAVPDELRRTVERESEERKKRQAAKQREREMVNIKVYYQGHKEEKTVRLHQSTKLSKAVEEAAKAWDVHSKFPPECIRLRNYAPSSEMPQEPLDKPEQLEMTLDELRFYTSKSVLLETTDVGTAFPAYDPSSTLLRVIRYDPSLPSQFTSPADLWIDKDATLGELKQTIADKFGLPLEHLRLFREASYNSTAPAKQLTMDHRRLRNDLYIYDNTKIWAESFPVTEEDFLAVESPCFKEIERTRDLIEISYNLPGSKAQDQHIQVSKRMLYGEFKKLLAEHIHLPVDQFKVGRGTPNWNQEIRAENDSLDDHYLRDGSNIFVALGKPLRDGETKISFVVFDPKQKFGKEVFWDLCEEPVEENIALPQLRVFAAQKLRELKQIDVPAENIRVRDFYNRSVSKVYHTGTLKDCANCLWSGKCIAVQPLDGPETANDGSVTFELVQWFPAKYELGERFELTMPEDTTADELRELLKQRFGIEGSVGLAKNNMATWAGLDPLDIPDLDFDKQPYLPPTRPPTLATSPLFVRDGDMVVFRDNSEPLKQLTKEEKRKLEAVSTRRRNYYQAKEEALTINATM